MRQFYGECHQDGRRPEVSNPSKRCSARSHRLRQKSPSEQPFLPIYMRTDCRTKAKQSSGMWKNMPKFLLDPCSALAVGRGAKSKVNDGCGRIGRECAGFRRGFVGSCAPGAESLGAQTGYQTRQVLVGIIGWPTLQLKALPKASKFCTEPFTRHLPGECGSVRAA